MNTDVVDHTTIYDWFDKCGVISNLRTQLRQNLVNALKTKDLTLSQPQLKSAKQYVYDLLIVEYLFKTNYAYSLSVFTSEASLPAYFEQLLNINKDNNNVDNKLHNDYLQHTLESLGIDPHDSVGHLILSHYAKKNESLLICILQSLKLLSLQKKNVKNNREKEQVVMNEKVVFKDEFTQTNEKDNCDRCKHFIHIKKKLLKQKEEFDKMLNEKSMKLKNQAHVAEQQIILLQEKFEQTQHLMNSLNTKKKQFVEEKRLEEERIHQKKLELIHKEEFLTKETNRLEVERNSYKQFEENLQRLQNELTKVKKGLSDETKNNYDTRETQVQTDFQSFTVILNENESLNRENADLKNLVHEQQERIKQLTHRAVQLSRQLEEAQLIKINSTQIPSRIPHTSTFISDGSSTEDILQDARIRLKRLEEESIQAEKRFHEYILKSNIR